MPNNLKKSKKSHKTQNTTKTQLKNKLQTKLRVKNITQHKTTRPNPARKRTKKTFPQKQSRGNGFLFYVNYFFAGTFSDSGRGNNFAPVATAFPVKTFDQS